MTRTSSVSVNNNIKPHTEVRLITFCLLLSVVAVIFIILLFTTGEENAPFYLVGMVIILSIIVLVAAPRKNRKYYHLYYIMSRSNEINFLRILLGTLCVVIHIFLVYAIIAVLVSFTALSVADQILCSVILTAAEGTTFAFLIVFNITLLILMNKVKISLGLVELQCDPEKKTFKNLCSALFGMSSLIAAESTFLFISKLFLFEISGLLALIIVQIVLAILLTAVVNRLKPSLANYITCIRNSGQSDLDTPQRGYYGF